MRFRPTLTCSFVLAVVLAIITILCWRRTSGKPYREISLVCLLTCLAALFVSTFAALSASYGTQELENASVSAYELEISSDMMPTNTGYRSLCHVSNGERLLGDAYFVSQTQIPRGTKLRCVGRFSSPDSSSWGVAITTEGILGSIRAVRIIDREEAGFLIGTLERLRSFALESIEPKDSQGNALIAALSLGWRPDFKETGLQDLFGICGLSHIAAVSGTHVSVVCALVAALFFRSRASPRFKVIALILITGAYVFLSGSSSSAIRAWIMCISASGAQMLGRRAHALSALSLTGLAMTLAKPGLSGNVGFLLSLSCVSGLCIFGAYATYVIETLVGTVRFPHFVPPELRIRMIRRIDSLSRDIAISLVACVASLPLTASAFGRVSLIGPIANALLALPLTALVSLSVASAATSWLSILQRPILALTRLLADASIAILKLLARIPGASISVEFDLLVALVLVVLCAFALYSLWPTVHRRALHRICLAITVICLVIFVRWRFFVPARLCVLDVGQGDAILIQDGSAAILVDTGPDASLTRELSKLNVTHLDAIVLTHLHDDHYGGLDDLYGQVACDSVYVEQGASDSIPEEVQSAILELTGDKAHELTAASKLHVGSFVLDVLWPLEPRSGTENNDSLVMLLTYGKPGRELTALLTGDAEHTTLESCEKAGLLADIDLLKVGHHGSEVSLDDKDAQLLKPELAVVSAGFDNPYGHPSEICVKTLEDAGAIVICTKDAGTIIVEPGETCLYVHETGASHEVQ